MEKKARTIAGPVHDLEKIKDLVKQGQVEFAGRPPDMRTGAKHDFTIVGVELMDGFQVNWQSVSAGFGQLYFYIGEDAKIHCSNETMSRDFVKSVLAALGDAVVLDDH